MRIAGFLFGIAFLVLGIAGFIPKITPDGLLFTLFKVNWFTNFMYIFFGLWGIAAGFSGFVACRTYLQITGIIYGVTALLGFVYEDEEIFGMMASNTPSTWLHMVMAVAALILGYGSKNQIKREGL